MFEQVFKYHYSKLYAYLMDAICLILAIELLYYLNGSNLIIRFQMDKLVFLFLAFLGISLFRGYSMLLRFTTLIDIGKIALGLFFGSFIYALYIGADSRSHFNYILLLFYFSLSILSLYRLVIKIVYTRTNKEHQRTNTMLFGAGGNGLQIKRALDQSNAFNVIGFIDDDPGKIHRTIEGIKVHKTGSALDKIIQKKNIKQVIITTEKINSKKRKELFQLFKKSRIKILTAPPLDHFASPKRILNKLQPIKIEDLLRRDEININLKKNKAKYNDKVILVTGAAGSIGSEIVRQLIHFKPKEIILYDNAETPLFNLKNELSALEIGIKFQYYLQSVTDRKAVLDCFESNEINTVFHAAAYKHVFMTETIPKAAIITNILGTKHVVDAAISNHVNQVVFVSSDKAVNPSNVMGATKRIAEQYVASKANNSKTELITTRFGNVLGSNGSVVPIFTKQIKNGGPITVTHPEITRYFMTITEACQLVLEAGAMGEGGEIYVFDMGKPVKIKDLAINMIHLSGLIEGQDISIEYTGLRPGEKLYEELLTDKENLKQSHNNLIYIADKEATTATLLEHILTLIDCAKRGQPTLELVALMKQIVPEFKSMNSIYDVLD